MSRSFFRFNSSFRVHSLAIAGACALAVVTAGCSTGGDDDASSTTTTPASAGSSTAAGGATTPSDDGDDDDGDGSASGDLVSWAGDFCDAVRPMSEKLQGFGTPTDASDPSALIAQYQALLAEIGPAMSDASDAIDGLDAPPIDNGDELKQQMITLLDQSATAFATIADQIGDLDPSDPNALADFEAALSGIGPDLEKSGEALDKAFSDPDMTDAFDSAPECDGLDMGS